MRYVFIIATILFFVGCSEKINPAQFHRITAPKSYLPSYTEITSKTQVLIAKFKGKYADIAKNYLSYILNNSKSIILLSRKFKTLKDEIKLAELAKNSNSNLNEANYLIFGTITDISTSYIYHKPYYWRDKKGRVHYVPGYYTHKACVSGNIKIIKIPQNYLAKEFFFRDCEYEDTNSRYFDYDNLIKNAIKNAVFDLKYPLYRFFSKRGYIFEIRKKDDKIILHTTLGKNFGAKKGERVDIFRIKKVKIPFTKKEKTEIVKIGEGKIEIVNNNDSWVFVTKGKNFMIGDFVKMNYKHSFWDIF
ncbi:hypothetical protein [Caminibacter sp.]